MESHWIRHHKKKQAPQYVPRPEPEPVAESEHNDDDSPLVDMELSEAEKIRRDVEDRGLGAAVEIARMVFQNLNKKGA